MPQYCVGEVVESIHVHNDTKEPIAYSALDVNVKAPSINRLPGKIVDLGGEKGIAKKTPLPVRVGASLVLAEGEGFEPSMRVHRIRDFQSRALGQLCDPSKK